MTILFRGLRTDGKGWVEGDLLTKYPHHGENYTIVQNGCVYFEVIPETVGQLVGTHDREGKKIFKGDRMEHKTEGQFVVVWDSFWLGFAAKSEGSEAVDTLEEKYLRGCKIIGNVHEKEE
jgi:hypothetical protein